MEILELKNIDFNNLILFDEVKSTESSLFYDDNFFYKLYDSYLLPNTKEKKLLLLNDGDNILDVIIPDILIKNCRALCGCAMKRILNADSILKYRDVDCFFGLIYYVSLTLVNIHKDPRNIVVGDLHFNNILIDDNYCHYFVDFDSCMIGGIPQDRLSSSLVEYVHNRGDFKFDVSVRTDKLSMFLSTFNALFGKRIDNVSIKEYDERAEKLYTLRNMRNYFLEIKNNSRYICDVPYMNELVSDSDVSKIKKIKNR